MLSMRFNTHTTMNVTTITSTIDPLQKEWTSGMKDASTRSPCPSIKHSTYMKAKVQVKVEKNDKQRMRS